MITATCCKECARLKGFLSSNEKVVSFSKPQDVRSHIESQVLQLGLRSETVKRGRPFTLNVCSSLFSCTVSLMRFQKITKPDSASAAALRAANSAKGQDLLKSLGDTTAQQRILGDEFDELHAKITIPSTQSEALSTASLQPFISQKQPLDSNTLPSDSTHDTKRPK